MNYQHQLSNNLYLKPTHDNPDSAGRNIHYSKCLQIYMPKWHIYAMNTYIYRDKYSADNTRKMMLIIVLGKFEIIHKLWLIQGEDKL